MAPAVLVETPGTSPNGWALHDPSPSAVPPLKDPSSKQRNAYVAPDLPTGHKEPLKNSGSLLAFEQFDTTPVLGTEFPSANLVEWMKAPNSDQLLRDLAITVSRRGVVFFRSQNDMTLELQKELAQRLGLLSGKPPTSSRHIYPITHTDKQGSDPEVTTITHEDKDSEQKAMRARIQDPKVTPMHKMWHSDTTFEPVPSDYAVLRMAQSPRTGGDTMWASCYEVYDRLSRPIQAFLETLTFTGGQPRNHQLAAANGLTYYTAPRGAPENVGTKLRGPHHPVVRTNPVTGWNSVYCLGHHVEFINGVTPDESRRLLDWMNELVLFNHDLQVRHRWQNPNDMAIWDNRSLVHTATPDYLDQGLGNRQGFRVLSIGERPYFDPKGKAKSEALAEEAAQV